MSKAEVDQSTDDQLASQSANAATESATSSPHPESLEPLEEALTAGNDVAVAKHLSPALSTELARHPSITSQYAVIVLMDSETTIGDYELDRIYAGLSKRNGDKKSDVLLCLLSSGGSIEPAYRISKLCKAYSAKKFVVCVPRYAKSAATLIALGADEIHLGTLGQLGPIDPQFSGMPALAIPRALTTLAELVQKFPASSDMLSKYLVSKLKLEQIGYFERVVESAVQYAERLLAGKKRKLARPPAEIATSLVHEYKDHGFVIDYDEASELLGTNLVKTNSPETLFAEGIYSLFFWWQFLITRRKTHGFALFGSLHVEDLSDTLFVWPVKK